MSRLWRGRLWFFVSFCLVPAAAQVALPTLELGRPVERELAGGRSDTYLLRLTANQIAHVVVEQQGIDVVLSVFAPDGGMLFSVDSPNGSTGEEPATVAARQAGPYRLDVRALDPSAAVGRYTIRLNRFVAEEDYQTERLAGLGRLWGAVKFFHPFLAYKEVDWDGALVRAIPHVKAARTPTEYRSAINAMLEALGDPATTAEVTMVEGGGAPAAATSAQPKYFYDVDGYVVVNAASWVQAAARGISAASAGQAQLLAAMGNAKGVVLDCRAGDSAQRGMPVFILNTFLTGLLPSVLHGVVPLGSERYRVHSGYAPQQGNSSGGYSSALLARTPDAIVGQAKEKKPLAVIVDERTPDISAMLSGVQAAGAAIVRVGKTGGHVGARTTQIPLPDGVRVSLRVADIVYPTGDSTLQPDLVLTNDAGAGDAVIRSAIEALHRPVRERRANAAAPVLLGQKDNPYQSMPFPSEEYRLLALFRYWNVINYFFPYKHLIDAPWSSVLTDFIPRFAANKSALDYETTIAEMIARMQDSHGSARPLQTLNDHLGSFAPPLRLASAGGAAVVVDLLDLGPARAKGIERGDVILTIDGVAVAHRLAALSKLRALSTPQAAYSYVYPGLLRGAQGSRVTVRVQGPGGDVREVALTRTVPLAGVSGMLPRKTPVYEVMANGYGYIDLARLQNAEAHKALDAVMKAPAIVFDMRGYPNGTAWPLAPRLGTGTNVTAALFRRPLLSALELDSSDLGGGSPDYAFAQKLPPAGGAIYEGTVVMLINEFAISQSEHTCLFFEAATDVTFVGTPTNGANGDVTSMVLPGGIYVWFTGHDVRHADGRQLQRIGIEPDIEVAPTAKGISEGRDEVLDAAVKHLDRILKKK